MSDLSGDKKWALERYAVWEQNSWRDIKIERQNSYLSLSCSQLFIDSKEMLHESLNLLGGFGQIESFFTNATLAIHITNKNKSTKFRVCFADGFRHKSSRENCLEVTEELQKFIKVTQHLSHDGKTPEKLEKKKYPELIKEMFEKDKFNIQGAVDSFMNETISEKSLRMFLLDPRRHAMMNKVSQFMPKVRPNVGSKDHCKK